MPVVIGYGVGVREPEIPSPDEPPRSPSKLGWRGIRDALKRTVKEFRDDELNVWAAALTYYGVLSIFPGLLVLVAVFGLLDESLTQSLRDNVGQLMPQTARQVFDGAIENVKRTDTRPGLAAIIGLAVALWSASGYVSAFTKAANNIYDVRETRPFWKTMPLRLIVTIATGVLLVASTAMVVLSGRLAEQVGRALNIGEAAVRTWDVAKWPVLLLMVSLMLAILYWATPNARQGGFQWVTPGSLLAVLLWLVISAGFGVYVANFGSYNETYGTVASVIVFLVWLWLTNLAVLFGAEFDAELSRGKAIAAGYPEDREPYVHKRG
ncbi:YihY/virulence factor BrkB family protein [Allorhizocola rhizosphaerae]|uniref:YihY/virulence factor BrkB family protein n=1 Tax=Allorhizocola rhizosphaerae TaxID=1872709 RepID=UPI000E3C2036|nr:YihY/virulence factor BrkB family protein [Allorhizocola rhizosphaerae]